jgi:hypothetical protein
MLDNPDQNMTKEKILFTAEYICTLKDIWHLRREMSHLSVQTKLDSFYKPALLRSKTSTTSESSIDE